MRTTMRLAVLGILIISCTDPMADQPPTYDPYVPPPCVPTAPDTVFAVYQDSVRLVVGSAEWLYVEWGANDGCAYDQFPVGEITWTMDTLVATTVIPDPDYPARFVVPKAPGSTVLVIQALTYLDSVLVTVPDTTVMGPVASVAAGGDVSCAVTEDGDAMCWGSAYTLLGDWEDPLIGTCPGSPCSPMPIQRVSSAEVAYVGVNHACTLDAFGGALCWGDNGMLQLGETAPGPSFDPVVVSGGLTFTALTLGWQHTCGLTSDGAGYCWGDHTGGKLGGDQRSGPVRSPSIVDDSLRWSSIDAEGSTTCGATDDGHLYCWGLFESDSVPPGAEICEISQYKGTPITSPCSYVPLRIQLDDALGADTVFIQVSGECALTTLGSVYCLERSSVMFTPRVGFGPYTSITSGFEHSCGLTAAGDAQCWGSNWQGQLGDGTDTFRNAPVMVSGGHTWTQIAAGGRHTCGLTIDEVWCWGASDSGQAGESVLDNAWSPVKVHGQD